MKNFKIIISLVLGLALASDNFLSQDNFKIIYSSEEMSSIVFEPNFIDLETENEQSKFMTNDLVGVTMDEGRPQLPVYSTLFQIDPNKEYQVEYEILDSYTLNDVKLENYNKDGDIYSVYPEENLYVSEPQVMRGIVLNQIGITPYKYFSNHSLQ